MKWLKIRAVAEKLGISPNFVRQIAASDKSFPRPIKLSERLVVYEESAIEEWMRKQAESVDQLTGEPA